MGAAKTGVKALSGSLNLPSKNGSNGQRQLTVRHSIKIQLPSVKQSMSMLLHLRPGLIKARENFLAQEVLVCSTSCCYAWVDGKSAVECAVQRALKRALLQRSFPEHSKQEPIAEQPGGA